MVKVSVIIPVYKTEKYLEECIDSVLLQDYENLEIILVDDGSPDGCPAICDCYGKKYENIQVIHKPNTGQGLSRNCGLEAATGDFVFFLDSDDCLDGREAISELVSCAEEKQADITVGCFRRFQGSQISEVNHHHLSGGEYTKTAEFRFKGFYMYGHLAYDWGKLYRKQFLDGNHLRCGDYPFTQDKAHNMCCYACRPVYAFLDSSVYLYRVNENSVTFRYKENFMPVWISIAADFGDFLAERGIEEDYGDLTAFHIFFGSFFLVKQELHFQRHGMFAAARALKKYGQDTFARQNMHRLAGGSYLSDIGSLSWKLVIRAAALLFDLHGYLPLVFGIALLRKLQVDRRITDTRYKKAGK